MSRFVQTEHGLLTDHSEEVAAMRQRVADIVHANPADNPEPVSQELRQHVVILAAAAALLEVHDATGISLDDWVGPYELVVEALDLIGRDEGTFLANAV